MTPWRRYRDGVGVQGLYLRSFCSLSNSTDVGIKLFVFSICGQRAGFLGSAAGCGRGEATRASLFSLLLTGFLRHASKRNCKVDSCICSWPFLLMAGLRRLGLMVLQVTAGVPHEAGGRNCKCTCNRLFNYCFTSPSLIWGWSIFTEHMTSRASVSNLK